MNISKEKVVRMIDISAVRADSCQLDVENIVQAAIEHRFLAVFTLPSFTQFAHTLLASNPGILLGGTVGFPSGGSSTAAKAFEADELLKNGCHELDMVINVGKLKSNLYQDVENDIKTIVRIAGNAPVKVILEVSLLTDKEIQDGSKIIYDSGASFVKTGTGWMGPTTFAHIALIKKAVGDKIPLKVAGGVRNLSTLTKMVEMGVSRFGIGYVAALNIINEFNPMDKSDL